MYLIYFQYRFVCISYKYVSIYICLQRCNSETANHRDSYMYIRVRDHWCISYKYIYIYVYVYGAAILKQRITATRTCAFEFVIIDVYERFAEQRAALYVGSLPSFFFFFWQFWNSESQRLQTIIYIKIWSLHSMQIHTRILHIHVHITSITILPQTKRTLLRHHQLCTKYNK